MTHSNIIKTLLSKLVANHSITFDTDIHDCFQVVVKIGNAYACLQCQNDAGNQSKDFYAFNACAEPEGFEDLPEIKELLAAKTFEDDTDYNEYLNEILEGLFQLIHDEYNLQPLIAEIREAEAEAAEEELERRREEHLANCGPF